MCLNRDFRYKRKRPSTILEGRFLLILNQKFRIPDLILL